MHWPYKKTRQRIIWVTHCLQRILMCVYVGSIPIHSKGGMPIVVFTHVIFPSGSVGTYTYICVCVVAWLLCIFLLFIVHTSLLFLFSHFGLQICASVCLSAPFFLSFPFQSLLPFFPFFHFPFH